MTGDKTYQIAQHFAKVCIFCKPRKDDVLKPTEIMVLMQVCSNVKSDNEGIIPTEICEELGLSKSSLTALLNSLEDKGFIERELSSEDRRKIIVRATSKAKDFHNQFHKGLNNRFNGISEYLGEEEANKLIELLEKTHRFLKSRKDSICENKNT